MFHYCYLTINKISGKIYIGSHSSEKEFDEIYFGSGLLLDRAIKKHSKTNFISFPIKYYSDRNESYKDEKKYIQLFESLNPNGYNTPPNGGVFAPNFHDEKTKQHFSKLYKNVSWEQKFGKEESDRRKKEYRLQRSGKTLIEILGEEGAKRRGEKIGKALQGINRSSETKEKIRKKLKGRSFEEIHGKEKSDQIKQNIGTSLRGKKRRKMSDQARKNMSNAKKGSTPWNKGLLTKKVVSLS
jgi:hypothetical protein